MPLRSNWLHDRSYFYKYLSGDTALKILAGRKLKCSSPLLFNDPFDIQFDLHVAYDRDTVASLARERSWAIYKGEISFEPKNAAGAVFAWFKAALPGLSKSEFDTEFQGVENECLSRGEANLPNFHAEFRNAMRDVKVLCFSEVFDNILMWSHYAKSHSGVVFRFSCLPELDSMWGAAQAVCYQQQMPQLVTQDEMVRMLTGEFNLSVEATLDKVVLTKAVEWSYEREWRVILHMTDPNKEARFIGFAPKELSAVYFGCNSRMEVRSEIMAAVLSLNPHAEIFQGRKSATQFALQFERIG